MSKQPATDQWLLQFLTYEDYLDSLVTPQDLLYLRSREAARTIAELGYRNANTLSREQFNQRRRAAALFQTPALLEQRDCSMLAGPISDPLLVALADRERANRRGDLATIIFIRLVDRAGHQVSGYIDFAHRIASDSWLRIFNGTKQLWPRTTDLGYFNWHTRVTKTNSSPNFKDHGELSSCIHEIVPRVSSRYHYIEPQGLFAANQFQFRYHHARVFCEQEGGRLAVPQNVDVFKKLKTLVDKQLRPEMFSNLRNAWLGLNDMETEGTWITVDGTRPPALPWQKGKPDNALTADCGQLVGELLSDAQCWKQQAFLCERRLRQRMPPGYTWCEPAQMFYKLYAAEKIFSEARRQCETDGGSLVSISTVEEALCVARLLPAPWTDPFVDFTDEAVEGEFVDSKGRLLESSHYFRWLPGQPDNGGSRGPENCLILGVNAYYEDVPCGNTHPYVCQLSPF